MRHDQAKRHRDLSRFALWNLFWYKGSSKTSQQQENEGSKITETKLSEELKE